MTKLMVANNQKDVVIQLYHINDGLVLIDSCVFTEMCRAPSPRHDLMRSPYISRAILEVSYLCKLGYLEV